MSKASEILGRSEAPANKTASSARPVQKQTNAPAKVRPAAKTKPVQTHGKKKNRTGSDVLRTILNHAAIVLSLMYLVLFVIDRINNAMEFINNDITKALLVLLAVIAIVNAEIALIGKKRKQK